jgi:tetratricopeptide (TPR) repeat protein
MLATNPRPKRLLHCTLGLLALTLIAAAEAPEAPPAHTEKLEEAQALVEEGKHNEAVKAFKVADKLAGGSCVECRIGLARTFNKLGAFREALKNVDAVLKATTDKNHLIAAYNEQGVANVALAGQDSAQLEQAVQAFRKVLELSEGRVNLARFNLGYTLLRLSRDEEGVALLKEYLERDPNPENVELAKSLIANPVRARKRLVPEFEVVTLAGDYLTSADAQGKVLLLDFWGTWCAPCVAAVPSLRALARRMDKDPFLLLSVSTDSDEKTLREFVAKYEMSWPQVWDKRHEMARKCQIEGYPTYILVNHEGEIVHVVRGWGTGIERDLMLKVSTAIRAAKKSGKAGG